MKIYMSFFNQIRNSHTLRAPLLKIIRLIFSLLNSGPKLLRRAVYDSISTPYLVTGYPENYIVSTNDKVIGRDLFLQGEFDFYKLQLALSIIEREGHPAPEHLIDVGANIGTIVIPALSRGLIYSATAIEPHPENLRLLYANLALNGVSKRVSVIEQAVGDVSNTRLFLKESITNSGNHSIGSTGIAIDSTRIDDLNFTDKKSLLWMDIEGYEGHALKGAEKTLATGAPVVCEYNIEYLKNSGGLDFFTAALSNYKIFDLKDGLNAAETTFNHLSNKYSLSADFTDILALPKSIK